MMNSGWMSRGIMKLVLNGKFILLIAIILLIAVFRIFELNQYLTLDYLKASRDQFSHLYAVYPVAVIAVYMAGRF